LTRLVSLPPAAQLAPLIGNYNDAVTAKRRHLLLGLVAIAIALLVSAVGAEVQPVTLWNKIGNFTSYFDRLLKLDTGARVWTDPLEWVFALIFVAAFGLGALPGILAVAIHTTGTLGKLFTEVVENIDMGPVEGVASTGGSWLAQVRFAVTPQVLSNLVSYALLRFEINVRGSTVIGFVGAGGIGQDLIVAIRKFYYSDVSAMLLMIIVTVMTIDIISARLRHRLLAMENH